MGKYISIESLGEDFIYNMQISTATDDFSPLILNIDGGIEEGMFLDLYLIFSYIEKNNTEILPFLRTCFHLLEERCSKEELIDLLENNISISKDKDSGEFSAMLGLKNKKSRARILQHVLADDSILKSFNETVAKSITSVIDQKSEVQDETVAFAPRGVDARSVSPLLKVLAGVNSYDKVHLPFAGENGDVEETREKIDDFIKKIQNKNLKGELVVSFRAGDGNATA